MKFLNSDNNFNFVLNKDITTSTLTPVDYTYNKIDGVNSNVGNLSNIVELVLTNVTYSQKVISGNVVNMTSESDGEEFIENNTYIFDRLDVRIIFITLYTLVFCCCFFGNLLVILVVTLSRRLRSITNFFLANLAVADLCVGVFCVIQNLSIYLIDSWVFGEFLCRMYQFIHSLSYTASIFILVVICMERYFAIVHPITCKQILTAARLRMVIVTVWITSAIYSTPKFLFAKTIENHFPDGKTEIFCALDRQMFNSKVLDLINFGLLYITPLLVMTVLYSKIAIALWKSSKGITYHSSQSQYEGTQMYCASNSTQNFLQKQNSKRGGGVCIAESQVSLDSNKPIVTATCNSRKSSFYNGTNNNHHSHHHNHQQQQQTTYTPQRYSNHRVSHNITHSSNNVLRARRGVVRMLIIFVLTFALCNLPYHARKMWQYWSRSYEGGSDFNALFTPLTFLVTYFNSGVNPLLYAFLSRNFRKGMKELLLCSFTKGKNSSLSSSAHHKRMPLQAHHSLPTESTHLGNDQL